MKARSLLKSAAKAARLIAHAASTAISNATPPDPIPDLWEDRVAKAYQLFLTNGAVKKGIKTWVALIFGEEIRFVVAGKTSRKKLEKFVRTTRMDGTLRDVVVNRLVRGEGVPFKHREGKKFTRLRSLNPLSLDPVWEDGILTDLRQLDIDKDGKIIKDSKGTSLKSRVGDAFYLRQDASEWQKHGNSLVLAAFELCDIQADYRKADRAIARRFASILRFVKIGGQIGNKIFVPTTAQLNAAKKTLDNLDPEKAVVVPSYWDVKDYGTEGQVLNIVERVKHLDEEIAMALLFYPVFLTGYSGDFATARSLLKVLRFQILEFRADLRALVDWIFSPDVRAAIGIGANEEIELAFSGVELDVEEWERRLLKELYDDGVLSRRTLQVRFGFDPDTEDDNIKTEPIRSGKFWKPADVVNAANAGVLSKKAAQALAPGPKASATVPADDPADDEPATAPTARPARRF